MSDREIMNSKYPKKIKKKEFILRLLKIESKRDTNSNRNKQIKLNYQYLNNLEKMNPKDYYLLINQWDSWKYLNNPKKMYDKVYNGILKSINHLKKLNEVNI